MATDVRYRLSAESKEVTAAFARIAGASKKSAREVSSSWTAANGSLRAARGLLLQLGVAFSAASAIAFVKRAGDAAEAALDMSDALGTTIERFSAYVVAGHAANLTSEQVNQTLAITAKRMKDLREGDKAAAKDFASIGLRARDLAGKDTAEGLELIARNSRGAADGMTIFGDKLGRKVSPLLKDINEQGLEPMVTHARELGLVFTGQMGAAADQIGRDFGQLERQVQVLAASFLVGLQPAVTATTGTMSRDLGANVKEWEKWGARVGLVILRVTTVVENMVDTLGFQLKKLGIIADAISRTAQAGPLSAGAFSASAAKQVEAGRVELEKRLQGRLERVRQTEADIAAGKLSAVASPTGPGRPNVPFRPEDDAKARKAAEDAAERAIKEAETARRAWFEALQRIQELRGEHHAANLADIDEEVRRFEDDLGARPLGQEDQGRSDQLRAALVARAGFDEAARQSEVALDELDARRSVIDDRVAAGLQTEISGERELLAIEKARVPELERLAAAMLAMAQATDNAGLIADAQEFSDRIALLRDRVILAGNAWAEYGRTARDAVEQGLTDAFTSGEDAAESFFRTVLVGMRNLAAQRLSGGIADLLFGLATGLGGGGSGVKYPMLMGVGKAEGGLITGPGTGTSDSILMRGSRDEYVVKAARVRQPGALMALESFNRFGHWPRFAEGGLVGAAASAPTSGTVSGSVNVGVNLGPGLVAGEMTTPAGQRATIQTISANRRAIKAALGIG